MSFPRMISKHQLLVPTVPPRNKEGQLIFKNPQPKLRKLVKNTNAYINVESAWVLNTNKG